MVIPAHPLALTEQRKLDEKRQRALTRYYIESGVGGIAVGVHTTQFAIRDPKIGLLRPVLELAVEAAGDAAIRKIAGVCGPRAQALQEAELAASLGYDSVLLSLGALRDATVAELLDHSRAVASVIPVVGFYLQTSVGGRVLSYEFWRQFVEIENVVAVKIAPFNRYQTLDVVRAVVEAGRGEEITLYTGNDDNILIDLLTTFDFGGKRIHFSGGLLGHWAVWTEVAVRQMERVKEIHASGEPIPQELFTLAQQITEANAAIFDPAHEFRGCIPGIHEVLCRQGLLAGRWCLDPDEELSPGQSEQIDRIYRLYPHLCGS
jgi:hypothetical protein